MHFEQTKTTMNSFNPIHFHHFNPILNIHKNIISIFPTPSPTGLLLFLYRALNFSPRRLRSFSAFPLPFSQIFIPLIFASVHPPSICLLPTNPNVKFDTFHFEGSCSFWRLFPGRISEKNQLKKGKAPTAADDANGISPPNVQIRRIPQKSGAYPSLPP